jgi:hypothetical protein
MNDQNTILLEDLRENSEVKADKVEDIEMPIPDEDDDLEDIERIRTGGEA